MEFAKIVGLCVLGAVLYGILHDQVTARICVEYFTVGHPRIVASEDPTVLGLVWGVVATWWVGAALGLLLALAARAGRPPYVPAAALVRPVLLLLVVMGAFALVSGIAGSFAGRAGWVHLTGDVAARLPPDRHVPFLTDLWAHTASYLVGLLGGGVLAGRVLRARRRLASTTEREQGP